VCGYSFRSIVHFRCRRHNALWSTGRTRNAQNLLEIGTHKAGVRQHRFLDIRQSSGGTAAVTPAVAAADRNARLPVRPAANRDDDFRSSNSKPENNVDDRQQLLQGIYFLSGRETTTSLPGDRNLVPWDSLDKIRPT
jgi:hypothetical protein